MQNSGKSDIITAFVYYKPARFCIYDDLWNDNVSAALVLYDLFFIGMDYRSKFPCHTLGRVVNRGFLNGPVCPVYGSGVVMVLITLYVTGIVTGFNTNVDSASPVLLFIIGIVFSTLIEFVAGFILDKLFHARWWDYSDMKFNVNGYICLAFSIIWGLAIAFVLRVVQPAFESLVNIIPYMFGVISLIIIYTVFIADIIITVLTVLKLNKELEKMEYIQKSILKLSDGMSEIIGTGTIKAKDKIDDEYLSQKAELEDRFEHIKKALMYRRLFGTGRLLTAFPGMKHHLHQKMIDTIMHGKH